MLLMMRAVSLRQEHDDVIGKRGANLASHSRGRFGARGNCCTLGAGLGDYR